MRVKRHINYYFLIIVILLAVLGILFLATLSAPASLKFFKNTNYYFFHQLTALLIGLVAALIFTKIPLSLLKKIAPILLLINLLLLVIVFFPQIGIKLWGAKRWISLWGNTFQPSEFLKITSILYLAALLSSKFSDKSKRGWLFFAKNGYYNFTRLFLPFLALLTVISTILLFQKDLSSLGIIIFSLLVVYFVVGTPIWHTITTILLQLSSLILLIKIEPYRVQRLLTLFNPESDPLGKGFQIKQSLLAIGSGGIFGKGWGMSTQKFGFLPQAMSDSTFAILGEETGIIGSLILITLLLLFLWQGIKIAKQASDKFSRMAASGITSWILIQSFMSIASSVGIWPLSGIPLPFFSYGGSHLVAEIIGVGILLNISKNG